MLAFSNLLALALIAAGAPPDPRPPANPNPVESLAGPEEGASISIGAQKISLGGFEPVLPGSAGSEVVPDDANVIVAGAREVPPGDPRSGVPEVAPPRPADREVWNLSLREAIRIGLENSEVIRVVASRPDDGPGEVVIERVNPDASVWNLRAAVMAHVRTIEQQYWSLSQQRIALGARETAVRLGEEILCRERGEFERGHGVAADIAEAEQQLENFRLNLVAATSDLTTTEKQFRTILGLPDDGRRIVAVTPPVEARVTPDWEACLRTMHVSQPDIAQHEALARLAELQLLLARNQLLPRLGLDALYQLNGLGRALDQAAVPDLKAILAPGATRRYLTDPDPAARDLHPVVPPPLALGRAPLANTRQAQYRLIRQRAALEQVVHQATHTLARFFLEVDANHNQFRAARRLRAATQKRLEAQRAFYDEGRITVDRLLDAVNQDANAIAQEAQYLAGYNTSIAALEEAKGTLMAFDGIRLADEPPPRDDRVAPAAFEGPAPTPSPAPDAPRPAGKTIRLRARVAPGVLDLEIEIQDHPEDPDPSSR